MPTASGGKDHETIVATKVDASQSAVVPNGGVSADMPLPLPVQVIERNRLTLAEILTLPRFRDYRPGEPSKVRDSVRKFVTCSGRSSRIPRPSPPPVLIVAAFRSRHTSLIPRLGILQAIKNWKRGRPGNEAMKSIVLCYCNCKQQIGAASGELLLTIY